MKRFLSAAALFICGAVLAGVIFLVVFWEEISNEGVNGPVEIMSASGYDAAELNRELMSDAFAVVKAIRGRDYQALAEWVHPTEGVYFIPYSTVKQDENQHFSCSDVRNFANNQDTYVWGTVDGEGSPISMTPEAYISRYVYDFDFLQAQVIGINTVVKVGNSLENVKDAFPGCEFVEFHYPGSAEYEGLDWKSLKLVFSKEDGKRHLIAIIHSEWTV
jgi:hypothetical protein